jgi:hypothetical protein
MHSPTIARRPSRRCEPSLRRTTAERECVELSVRCCEQIQWFQIRCIGAQLGAGASRFGADERERHLGGSSTKPGRGGVGAPTETLASFRCSEGFRAVCRWQLGLGYPSRVESLPVSDIRPCGGAWLSSRNRSTDHSGMRPRWTGLAFAPVHTPATTRQTWTRFPQRPGSGDEQTNRTKVEV